MNRHLLAILTCICLSVQLNATEWGSGASSAWENKIDLTVKDYMSGVRQGNYLHFDNYLQYAPLAASVLLSICPDYRDGWQGRILLAGTGSAKIAYWLLPWEKRQLGKVSFLLCFAETPDGNIAQGLTLAITF